MLGPRKSKRRRTISWKIAWPMMCLSMVLVMSLSSGELGDWLRSYYLFGGYVAKASAAKLSIIRFTQSICTEASTDCLIIAADTRTMQTAIMFTVSWNCRNLRIDVYTFRPQTTAFTIELKLSSRIMMSEAFFDTWVPVIPIASPMSALIKAGASFAPSPVTPTIWPSLLIPSTNTYLCYGLLLAITTKSPTTSSNAFRSSSFSMITFLSLLEDPGMGFPYLSNLGGSYFNNPRSSRALMNSEASMIFPFPFPWLIIPTWCEIF